MFGRFLELGVATGDIRASVQFYERLGFKQLIAGDAWPHRYGVLGDGRLPLGLHESAMPAPAITFVLPKLERAQRRLLAAGIEPELTRLGDESLNQLRLRDPAGHPVVLLEARTFSPAPADSGCQSLCGYFLHLSLPQSNFAAARDFWERGGFVALPELDEPYLHLPLTSDGLDLAFHQRRTFDAPMLVFESSDLPQQLARLRELGLTPGELPAGITHQHGAMLQTPEGAALLLLQSAA